MISPQAIEQFLARTPETTLEVRGKDPDWLRDIIKHSTGVPFRPKTPWLGTDRDQRQLEAVAFALVVGRALLYYAPRTGKTRVTLDWLQHLRRAGWIQKGLVVAHAPIGVDEWEIQVPRHSDLRADFVRSGPGSTDAFAEACASDSDVLVTAPSTLQQLFSEKRLSRRGQPKLYPDREALQIAAGCFQAVAVDEIHGSMNPGTLRHEIAAGLAAQAQYRLGLTGTPFGRDPFGLWGQSFIIDGGATLGRNYYFFEAAFGKQQYNHFRKTKTEYVFDPKKMLVLQDKLRHMTLSCRLEEIQDVQVIASKVELRMTAPQQRAYRELIDDMIHAEDRQEVENIFVRLRQVSSGFRPFRDADGDERVVEFSDSAKHEWLREFLSDLDPDLKVVVFHEFVHTGERVAAECAKLKIDHRRLWGGTKDRREVLEAFQRGRARVLVANHATGGTGIDLSAADYMCVFESPVSVITRQQMLARPLARGSRPLLVDDLVCSPVEEKILRFHEEGRGLMDLFSTPRALAQALT